MSDPPNPNCPVYIEGTIIRALRSLHTLNYVFKAYYMATHVLLSWPPSDNVI
jgi:hypothetical protein